ncbi:MAG: hypothetical protein IJK85_06605 [Bacteroidales bacterium]|nr:hypothetical protein [Bacteroidales bacterium]
MKRVFCNSLIFAVLFLWQLPQNLVALLIMPFLGRLTFVDYRHYCFGFAGKRFPKNASGISLGSFAFFHPEYAHDAHTIRHEMDGHTVDSKLFGPLYLLIIGIPSILHLAFKKEGSNYYDFYTERRANRHAGLPAR